MHRDDAPAPGTVGTAVVALPRGRVTARGMWQRRTDGAMFLVFPTPEQNTLSAHVSRVVEFEED